MSVPEGGKTVAIPIRLLILPKFGSIKAGTGADEVKDIFDRYFIGSEEYEIRGGVPGNRLYVKNGLALYVTGMGKVNVSASVTALLLDTRFDYENAYILSTGCAGGSVGLAVLGDVFVMRAAVDFDSGHHIDVRESSNPDRLWYRDPAFDETSFTLTDPLLTEKVYALVKDLPLETPPKAGEFTLNAFPEDSRAWAQRRPSVRLGTTLSSDNFWKGRYPHETANAIVRAYGCPDPYALTEMEDSAIGAVLRRFGMEKRYIVIRACVNFDLFPKGVTPDMLWLNGSAQELSSEDSLESAGAFETAMRNNLRVISTVADAIMQNKL